MLEHPDLQQLQNQLNHDFIGKRLQKINFVQVNPQYFEFDENSLWVLDGGIELHLENHKIYTFAWNNDAELMDLWQGNADVKMSNLDFYALDKINDITNATISNKIITAVDFEWNWYQMMDENFELEDKLNFAPLGMVLHFDDGQHLQLASVQFGLEDKSLANLSYLPEGDMLVSINRIFPIHLDNQDEDE